MAHLLISAQPVHSIFFTPHQAGPVSLWVQSSRPSSARLPLPSTSSQTTTVADPSRHRRCAARLRPWPHPSHDVSSSFFKPRTSSSPQQWHPSLITSRNEIHWSRSPAATVLPSPTPHLASLAYKKGAESTPRLHHIDACIHFRPSSLQARWRRASSPPPPLFDARTPQSSRRPHLPPVRIPKAFSLFPPTHGEVSPSELGARFCSGELPTHTGYWSMGDQWTPPRTKSMGLWTRCINFQYENNSSS
jgi:hypothetical protein